MADWLGGITGGLAGLGNALMALRELQNQESLTKMKMMEGQGTWVPAQAQGNFLQNLLSIAPEGMVRVGNQAYQLQPFPMLGEEGARALGFGMPTTRPIPAGASLGLADTPVGPALGTLPTPATAEEEAVPSWVSTLRMDPRTMQTLLQQQFLAKQQAAREAASQRIIEIRQDAMDRRRQREQERMFAFMKDFYGSGTPSPAPPAPTVPGMPSPSPAPGVIPGGGGQRPSVPMPAPRPFVPQGEPQGYRLPENWVPPTGFDALPLPQRHAFVKRATQIDALMQERNRLAEKPALSMGGVSVSAERKISGLDKQIALLEKQQNDALAQVQDVARVGAETGQRLEVTQAFKEQAFQQAEQYIAVGDWKGAQRVMASSGIPESQWPEDLQRRKKVFESQLKTNQQAGRLAEQASQYSEAAIKAWEQLNGMVQAIFTVPGGDPLARAKQRLSLEKQAIWQIPPLDDAERQKILADPTLTDTQKATRIKMRENPPDVATYEDTALAHIITITKALTGTGRMAASEVFQMLKGLPTISGRGGLPDSKDVAARKMKNIYDLLQAAGKRPINPTRAFDLQETNPGERDPSKRFHPVPLAQESPGAIPAAGAPAPTEMSDDDIEAEIRRLEGGK